MKSCMTGGIMLVTTATFNVSDNFSLYSDSSRLTVFSQVVIASSMSRISFTAFGLATSVMSLIALAIVFGLYFLKIFCHARKPSKVVTDLTMVNASPIQYWLKMLYISGEILSTSLNLSSSNTSSVASVMLFSASSIWPAPQGTWNEWHF